MTGPDDAARRGAERPDAAWREELQERLHTIFRAEAAERLDALDDALRALEADPGGPDTAHHVGEAFRHAHTIKGGARAIGLTDAERIAGELESTFGLLRGGAPAGPDTWRSASAAVDALRSLVGGPTG